MEPGSTKNRLLDSKRLINIKRGNSKSNYIRQVSVISQKTKNVASRLSDLSHKGKRHTSIKLEIRIDKRQLMV